MSQQQFSQASSSGIAINGWLVLGGLGFAAFGMIFVYLFFPFHLQRSLALDMGKPATTTGTVVKTEKSCMTSNDEPVYPVRFRFLAPVEKSDSAAGVEEGVNIEGRCYSDGRSFDAGESVPVEYLPDRPTIARIRGCNLDPAGYFGLFTVIFPLAGFIVAGVGVWRWSRAFISTSMSGAG